MGDSPEAFTPLMILMRDAEGRVVYEVWHHASTGGGTTADTHADAPVRSKAQARSIARTSGFSLVEEGEIWERLPDS